MNQLLEAVGLECLRGDRRLFKDIGFGLEPGDLLHVTGRNGSGKTTLLRMLCGLVRPAAGNVNWAGRPITHLGDEYLRHLTYVGHQNAIKDDLSARENLSISCSLSGQKVTGEQVAASLSRMGLKGHEHLPVRVLSQGQRRRVALSRLLLAGTALWVLDEPFSALDVQAVETLQNAIRGHLSGGGMLVLTTHQEVPLEGGRVLTLEMGARR
ncbi:MAG: cytochrome c biogenesis heme-transporting ATPase CcmA [Nitrospirota bacterium]|nr:cytochrome c biogenesis heme-transporting ATPase CcmA [Nitrospirota bacterium]